MRQIALHTCLGVAFALVGAVHASAQQPCRTVPSKEAASVLATAFTARMANTGLRVWRRRADQDQPNVYVSAANEMGLSVVETGGLASSITILVNDVSRASVIWLQVGANFVVARLSGRAEEATQVEAPGCSSKCARSGDLGPSRSPTRRCWSFPWSRAGSR